MKKDTFRNIVLLLLLASPAFLYAQLDEVDLQSLPETIEEFTVMRNLVAVTPEGGAAMFVAAMLVYNNDKDLGIDCFTVMLVNDGTLLVKKADGYKGYAPGNSSTYLIRQLDSSPWISNSYVFGTSPVNGYLLSAFPYKLKFMRNKYSVIRSDAVKVFVYSSGASTPRPITLERNSAGIWKVREFSSLVVGVRKVERSEADDL